MDKKIKIVRSDRGEEFFEKYTERDQLVGLFGKFLEEKGIIAQYIMSGIPQ